MTNHEIRTFTVARLLIVKSLIAFDGLRRDKVQPKFLSQTERLPHLWA